MGLDGAVGCWISDAGQGEALIDLIVIEEGLVAVVDTTGLHETSAGAACTSSA